MLIADLEHDHRQRDRHEFCGQTRLGKRRLGFLDRGILDESGIVRFAPDTVIYGRDLDGPYFVLVEPGRRLKRRLRMSRIDERRPQ